MTYVTGCYKLFNLSYNQYKLRNIQYTLKLTFDLIRPNLTWTSPYPHLVTQSSDEAKGQKIEGQINL